MFSAPMAKRRNLEIMFPRVSKAPGNKSVCRWRAPGMSLQDLQGLSLSEKTGRWDS